MSFKILKKFGRIDIDSEIVIKGVGNNIEKIICNREFLTEKTYKRLLKKVDESSSVKYLFEHPTKIPDGIPKAIDNRLKNLLIRDINNNNLNKVSLIPSRYYDKKIAKLLLNKDLKFFYYIPYKLQTKEIVIYFLNKCPKIRTSKDVVRKGYYAFVNNNNNNKYEYFYPIKESIKWCLKQYPELRKKYYNRFRYCLES